MATPTDDLFLYGMSVTRIVENMARCLIPLSDFLVFPDPGETDPFAGKLLWSKEPYDDGGGPVVAYIRFHKCT